MDFGTVCNSFRTEWNLVLCIASPFRHSRFYHLYFSRTSLLFHFISYIERNIWFPLGWMYLVAQVESLQNWDLGCPRLAWIPQGLRVINISAHWKPIHSTLVGEHWSVQLRWSYLDTALRIAYHMFDLLEYILLEVNRLHRIIGSVFRKLFISRGWAGWGEGHGRLE